MVAIWPGLAMIMKQPRVGALAREVTRMRSLAGRSAVGRPASFSSAANRALLQALLGRGLSGHAGDRPGCPERLPDHRYLDILISLWQELNRRQR
jgi:hypothetical protein